MVHVVCVIKCWLRNARDEQTKQGDVEKQLHGGQKLHNEPLRTETNGAPPSRPSQASVLLRRDKLEARWFSTYKNSRGVTVPKIWYVFSTTEKTKNVEINIFVIYFETRKHSTALILTVTVKTLTYGHVVNKTNK